VGDRTTFRPGILDFVRYPREALVPVEASGCGKLQRILRPFRVASVRSGC
jgi:hypothetical protein